MDLESQWIPSCKARETFLMGIILTLQRSNALQTEFTQWSWSSLTDTGKIGESASTNTSRESSRLENSWLATSNAFEESKVISQKIPKLKTSLKTIFCSSSRLPAASVSQTTTANSWKDFWTGKSLSLLNCQSLDAFVPRSNSQEKISRKGNSWLKTKSTKNIKRIELQLSQSFDHQLESKTKEN